MGVQSAAMGCVASLARRTRAGHKSVVVARRFLKFCVATRRCSSRQARTSALDAAASGFAAPATMLLLLQSEEVEVWDQIRFLQPSPFAASHSSICWSLRITKEGASQASLLHALLFPPLSHRLGSRG